MTDKQKVSRPKIVILGLGLGYARARSTIFGHENFLSLIASEEIVDEVDSADLGDFRMN